jgi:UPF0755 protein
MKKGITLFLCIIAGVCIFSLWVAYWFQHPQKNLSTVVLIEKGASLSQISQTLSKDQLLDFPLLFKIIVYGTNSWRQLKAGEYFIPPSVTPAQLIHILKSGDVILHPITVIEGEVSSHVIQKLNDDPRFQGICEVPTEGSLLPETYYFPRGTERCKIVERMKKSMEVVLSDLWAKRSPNHLLQSPEELLILASIVEKETAFSQERPIVAAVFLNRLKIGMPLQADPTVLYGLTRGKGDLGRALLRKDLLNPSPYNTYLHTGLPPSPIANPGLASLKATAQPALVDYLYFVANGSGGHVFATTLDNHQKNHARWRKVRDGSLK